MDQKYEKTDFLLSHLRKHIDFLNSTQDKTIFSFYCIPEEVMP